MNIRRCVNCKQQVLEGFEGSAAADSCQWEGNLFQLPPSKPAPMNNLITANQLSIGKARRASNT
jgi:hypothetical protein